MATDSAAVLAGERVPVFATASVREPELVVREQAEKDRQAWERLIDGRLVEWGRDASPLEDEEGFTPPGLEVVSLACHIAMLLRDEGLAPPTRVVPDGEGGISFERIEGRSSVSLNVYADLTVELLSFDDCHLCARHRLL